MVIDLTAEILVEVQRSISPGRRRQRSQETSTSPAILFGNFTEVSLLRESAAVSQIESILVSMEKQWSAMETQSALLAFCASSLRWYALVHLWENPQAGHATLLRRLVEKVSLQLISRLKSEEHTAVIQRQLKRLSQALLTIASQLSERSSSLEEIREALGCRMLSLRIQTLPMGPNMDIDSHHFADVALKAVTSAQRRLSSLPSPEGSLEKYFIECHAENFERFCWFAKPDDWSLEGVAAWLDHWIQLVFVSGDRKRYQAILDTYTDNLVAAGRRDIAQVMQLHPLISSAIDGSHDALRLVCEGLKACMAAETSVRNGSMQLRVIRVLEPLRRFICSKRPENSPLVAEILTLYADASEAGLREAGEGSHEEQRLTLSCGATLEALKFAIETYTLIIADDPDPSQTREDIEGKLLSAISSAERAVLRAGRYENYELLDGEWLMWLTCLVHNSAGVIYNSSRSMYTCGRLLERAAFWHEKAQEMDRVRLGSCLARAARCFTETRMPLEAYSCGFRAIRWLNRISSDIVDSFGGCVLAFPNHFSCKFRDFADHSEIQKILSVLSRLEYRDCARGGSLNLGVLKDVYREIHSLSKTSGEKARAHLNSVRVLAVQGCWRDAFGEAAKARQFLESMDDVDMVTKETFLAEALLWEGLCSLMVHSDESPYEEVQQGEELIDRSLKYWKSLSSCTLTETIVFDVTKCIEFASGILWIREDHTRASQTLECLLMLTPQDSKGEIDTVWTRLADSMRHLGFTNRSEYALAQVGEGSESDSVCAVRVLINVDKDDLEEALALAKSAEGKHTRQALIDAYLKSGNTRMSYRESFSLFKKLLKELLHENANQDKRKEIEIGGFNLAITSRNRPLSDLAYFRLNYSLRQVALAHERLELVEDAEYYLLRGAELAKVLGSRITESLLYSDAALISLRKGDIHQCEERLSLANAAISKISNTVRQTNIDFASLVLMKRGDVLLEKGSHEEALSAYDEAISTIQQSMNPDAVRSIIRKERDTVGRSLAVAGLEAIDRVSPPMEILSAKLQIRRARALLFHGDKESHRIAEATFKSLTSPRALPKLSGAEKAAALFGSYEALVCREKDRLQSEIGLSWDLSRMGDRDRYPTRRLRSRRETSESSTVYTHAHDLLTSADKLILDDGSFPRLASRVHMALGTLIGRRDPSTAVRCFASLSGQASELRREEWRIKRKALDLLEAFDNVKIDDIEEYLSLDPDIALVQLPCYWSVVGILPDEAKEHLMIWRLEHGMSVPVLVRRRLPTQEGCSYDDVMSRFREIIEDMNESNIASIDAAEALSAREKRHWWNTRFALEERLKSLLEMVEDQWLGEFRGLLLGKEAGERIRTGRKVIDGNLIDCLSRAELSDSEQSILHYQFSYDSAAQERFSTNLKSHSGECSRRGPVILVLEKEIQNLPWESLPYLDDQPMSRIPSLSLLFTRVVFVERSSTSYLLNPTGDLRSTQSLFEKDFEAQPGWRGFVGEFDRGDQRNMALLHDIVSRSDTFIYCGHNGAESFLSPRDIPKLESLPKVSLLMGCGSGRLQMRGDYDCAGTAIDYLVAGCPTVVANLWDVTDKDIDRLTMSVLCDWLGANMSELSEPMEDSLPQTISEAIARGRSACRLRYLVGAASVVYGSPDAVVRERRSEP